MPIGFIFCIIGVLLLLLSFVVSSTEFYELGTPILIVGELVCWLGIVLNILSIVK